MYDIIENYMLWYFNHELIMKYNAAIETLQY